jgi:hypothetical protein
MPPTDRKGTLFGGDAVHVALILQTRATARRARNALITPAPPISCCRARKCSGSRYHSKEAYLWPSSPGCVHSCPQRLADREARHRSIEIETPELVVEGREQERRDKVDLVIGPYGTNLVAPTLPAIMPKGKTLIGLFALDANHDFH